MKTQLQTVCGFAARRSPLNVMNCVRITKDFCYATDGSSSMRIGIEGPDMDVCVDAAMLANILGGMPDDQTVSISTGEGFITIKGGSRRLKLRTVANEGMPEIEVGKDFHEIDPAALSLGLKFAAPAAAVKNIANPALTQIVVSLGPTGSYVVGCDGMRLNAYKIDDKTTPHEVACLLPRHIAHRLAGLCSIGGSLKINRHRVVYEKGDQCFIATLSALAYPDWRRIIPDRSIYTNRVQLGGKTMAGLFENVSRLGGDEVEMIQGDGVLDLKADLKGDEFADRVECDSVGAESIKVRAAQMADAINAMGHDKPVTVHIPHEAIRKTNKPILFTNGTDHLCFAMPCRT